MHKNKPMDHSDYNTRILDEFEFNHMVKCVVVDIWINERDTLYLLYLQYYHTV